MIWSKSKRPTFWRDSPEIERGELKTEEIETEVFFFPAAGHAEKDGTFTQHATASAMAPESGDPPGDCRSDEWFMHQLALRLIAKAKQSNDPLDEPLRALDWWYPEDERGEPKWKPCWQKSTAGTPLRNPTGRGAECVVFGVDRDGNPHHGPQIDGYPRLKADGSTASGAWIYSGVLGPDKINKANSRNSKDYLGHGWGFAWPGDRRIIYNRASASPTGEPWSERKKLIWWDQAQRKWTGIDHPGFSRGQIARVSTNRKRKRARRDSRRCAIHFARRRSRLAACSERFAGWTDADALRTARVAGAQRALLARHEPGRSIGSRARKIGSRRRATRDFLLSLRPTG